MVLLEWITEIVNPELFGTIAATLTTACFVPQAIKVVREKETHAISLSMYLMFVVGVFFWFLYGIALQSWPMMIANVITFSLAMVVLVTKIRYG
jgi:MtN3 and saliva related transmembrane protein